MAPDTTWSTAATVRSVVGDWRLGLGSGLVGGLVAAGVVSFVDPRVLRVTMPALYGLAPPPDALLGWVVVLSHGSVLGVAFAALIEGVGLAGGSANEQVVAGVGFGVGSWLVLSVVALPLWLRVTGSSVGVAFPYVATPMLAGHVVYGLVLGVVYFAFDAAAEEPTETTAAD